MLHYLVKEAYSNRKVSSGKILGSVTDEAYLLVLELGLPIEIEFIKCVRLCYQVHY